MSLITAFDAQIFSTWTGGNPFKLVLSFYDRLSLVSHLALCSRNVAEMSLIS